MNIYVGNLSYNTTSADLTQLFSAHGEVNSARVIMDRDTNRSKGFGFVDMDNNSDAQAAIAALNDFEVDGRSLRINEATPREPRSYGSNRGYRN